MQGYYNNPEENAKVFENGWFHTGDLGYIDKDGYVFINANNANSGNIFFITPPFR